MPASSDRRRSGEASDHLARWIARLDAGEPVEIEGCLEDRADLEPELRGLAQGFLRVEGLLAEMRASADSSVEAWLPDGATDPQGTEKRYELREAIGRGGMGEVRRAYDRPLDRELAMKLCVPRGAARSDLRRFLHEARLTARLEHPGIVPTHDLGVDPQGRVYFTMPLVRGRTLAEVLRSAREAEGSWSRERALEVLLKVCDAVAYAHAEGVVHRDLKPANVMLGRFGEVYVMDWGLALDLRESSAGAVAGSSARGVVGTPDYMAPEQASGDPGAVGSAADVYSLGAILYELLSGLRPYEGRASTDDLLEVLRREPPAPIEDLARDAPADLLAICRKAMARDPAQRYPRIDGMAADLRAFVDGRVVLAHERGAWPELKKWIARNRGLAAALAAAIGLAIGGLAAVSYVQAAGKAEILRLSDVRRLADLEERATALWPPVPERIAAMETWLAEARRLAANRPQHERSLAALRTGAEVPTPGGFRFGRTEDQWNHDVLAGLVDRLGALEDSDPSRGLIASVERRLERARTIRARSLEDAAKDWAAAIASIGDPAQCPAYEGLRLSPQLGLAPIGRDPGSGLWEFAHLTSGAPATRRADGELAIDAETGIVLVLAPGGSFSMGSQPPVPGRPSDDRTDPLARADELPLHVEHVRPFFVSKYEVTFAQWERVRREDPALRRRRGAERAPRPGPAPPGGQALVERGRDGARPPRARAAERDPVGVRRARGDRDALVGRRRPARAPRGGQRRQRRRFDPALRRRRRRSLARRRARAEPLGSPPRPRERRRMDGGRLPSGVRGDRERSLRAGRAEDRARRQLPQLRARGALRLARGRAAREPRRGDRRAAGAGDRSLSRQRPQLRK
jgi:hypothetical protein